VELTKTRDFASQFRQHRRQRGLSIVRLSGLSGLAKTTLESWQSGRTLPSAPELERLVSALELGSFDQRLLRRLIGMPRAIASLPEGERPPLTGGLLRAMRLRRGLTQSEVARRLSVRQGTLAKWEKSDDWPDASKLSLLCVLLGAAPQEAEAILGGVFLPLPQTLSFDTPLEALEEQGELLIQSAFLHPNDPLLDLRFFELESLLWFHADRPVVYEYLWKIWNSHMLFLNLQLRQEESWVYNNKLLSIPYDASLSSTVPLQSAVLYKANVAFDDALFGSARARRIKKSIAFMQANEARIADPECKAWYWMNLTTLLIEDKAYDEAYRCVQRSNAIAHPEGERIKTGEARLQTASSLILMERPREGLDLLDSFPFDAPPFFTPLVGMRCLYYRAKALASLGDIAEALALLNQLFGQIEETGIVALRPRAEALFLELTHLP
jgi:transcriptional regulator with XRE-family HTH domain